MIITLMPCTVTEILSYCPNKYLSGSSSSFNAGCAFWRWLAHLNDTNFSQSLSDVNDCSLWHHWMQNPILFKYSLKGKKKPTAYSLYCHNMLFVYYFFMHCLYLLGFLQSFPFSYGNFTYIDNMFYHPFSLLFLHFWGFFHYFACLCPSWVLFHSLIRPTGTGPSFVLAHLLLSALRAEDRSLSDPAPLPLRLGFLSLVSLHVFPAPCGFVLIPAQHMDLAQPVTASVNGQRSLNHRWKFLQKVFREKLIWKSPSGWKV